MTTDYDEADRFFARHGELDLPHYSELHSMCAARCFAYISNDQPRLAPLLELHSFRHRSYVERGGPSAVLITDVAHLISRLETALEPVSRWHFTLPDGRSISIFEAPDHTIIGVFRSVDARIVPHERNDALWLAAGGVEPSTTPLSIDEHLRSLLALAEQNPEDQAMAAKVDGCLGMIDGIDADQARACLRVLREVASCGENTRRGGLRVGEVVLQHAATPTFEEELELRKNWLDLLNAISVFETEDVNVALRDGALWLVEQRSLSTPDKTYGLDCLAAASEELAIALHQATHALEAIQARRESLALMESADLPADWVRSTFIAHARLALAGTLWRLRALVDLSSREVRGLAWDAATILDGSFHSELALNLIEQVDASPAGEP